MTDHWKKKRDGSKAIMTDFADKEAKLQSLEAEIHNRRLKSLDEHQNLHTEFSQIAIQSEEMGSYQQNLFSRRNDLANARACQEMQGDELCVIKQDIERKHQLAVDFEGQFIAAQNQQDYIRKINSEQSTRRNKV